MKKFIILALGIVALIPLVSGTAVTADVSVTAQTTDLTPELAQALRVQSAGGTLSRPL